MHVCITHGHNTNTHNTNTYRDASILLLISPIFHSSNSFKFHLLRSKFCSLKNVHLPESLYQKLYYVTYKAYKIRLLTLVCKKEPSAQQTIVKDT